MVSALWIVTVGILDLNGGPSTTQQYLKVSLKLKILVEMELFLLAQFMSGMLYIFISTQLHLGSASNYLLHYQ